MWEGGSPPHPAALLICDTSPFGLRANMASQHPCVNGCRMDNDFTVLSILTEKVSLTPEAVREPGEQLWPLGLSISSPCQSRGRRRRRHRGYFWAPSSPLPAVFPSLCLSSFLCVALKSPPICQAPLSTKGGRGGGEWKTQGGGDVNP